MGRLWKAPCIYDVKLVRPGDEIIQFNQTVRVDTDAIMVTIRGGFTLIDLDDLVQLEIRRWNVSKSKRTAYVRYCGREEYLRLHNKLLQVPVGSTVDHKNGIGWDNRRCNLRPATQAQQARNQQAQSSNKRHSKYKGVTFDPKKRLYRARIMVDRKSIGLGRYKSEEAAAKAYDQAAKDHFGEYAVLNFQ